MIMAIQSLMPSMLQSHVGDRKPGLVSSGHEHVYGGESLSERPMSQRTSASSESSLQGNTELANFSFSENRTHGISTWKTSKEFYPQKLPHCAGGEWSPPLDGSNAEEYFNNLEFYSNQNNIISDDQTVPRRAATKESTGMLKEWLQKNSKNPYPTKSEKIMLAIVTKMTLTQVSTWFANARRRLKKENKMTWTPKHRSNELMDNLTQPIRTGDCDHLDRRAEGNKNIYDESVQMKADFNYPCSIPQQENGLNYYPLPDMSSTFGNRAALPHFGSPPPTLYNAPDSHAPIHSVDHHQSSPVTSQKGEDSIEAYAYHHRASNAVISNRSYLESQSDESGQLTNRSQGLSGVDSRNFVSPNKSYDLAQHYRELQQRFPQENGYCQNTHSYNERKSTDNNNATSYASGQSCQIHLTGDKPLVTRTTISSTGLENGSTSGPYFADPTSTDNRLFNSAFRTSPSHMPHWPATFENNQADNFVSFPNPCERISSNPQNTSVVSNHVNQLGVRQQHRDGNINELNGDHMTSVLRGSEIAIST